MKRCPITYEIITENERYSRRGLSLLSPTLKNLSPLNLSAKEQRQESIARVGKMSIQGIQPKLSAQLKVKNECFAIVDQKGSFILKPQSEHYPELPENEAITMTLAKILGLEVPVHGLIYSKDNSMTYFIKRFDRAGHNKKIPMEDFAQLSGVGRDTKYDSSTEKIIQIIADFCTFPKLEFLKFFKLTLFNFLIGNEDMHLKNFSLITHDNKVLLSPAYDLLNSTIALRGAKEELALPLGGKKSNLKKQDFFKYLAIERLALNENIISSVVHDFQNAIPQWKALLEISFLSKNMREKYIALLAERCERVGFGIPTGRIVRQ